MNSVWRLDCAAASPGRDMPKWVIQRHWLGPRVSPLLHRKRTSEAGANGNCLSPAIGIFSPARACKPLSFQFIGVALNAALMFAHDIDEQLGHIVLPIGARVRLAVVFRRDIHDQPWSLLRLS